MTSTLKSAQTGLLSRFQDPAQRRLIVLVARGLVLVAAIAAIVLAGLHFLGDVPRDANGQADFSAVLEQAKGSAWTPIIVIAVYVLLNFAWIPQFLLVGGTVVVFGPVVGFIYAWCATMTSSSVGFWLGHFFGGEILRRFAGDRANKLSVWLGRHGIAASAIVRVVPAGPALGVNMAAGVSHISFQKFLLGTAIGIAPKIFLIAAVGKSLQHFVTSGDSDVLVITVGSIIGWLAMMFIGRKVYKTWRARQVEDAVSPDTGADVTPSAAVDAKPSV